MPKIYITEYSQGAMDHRNNALGIPMTPPNVEQSFEIEINAKASAKFEDHTRFIMVHVTAACCLAFKGEAKADKHRLGSGDTRPYGVHSGGTVSFILSEE